MAQNVNFMGGSFQHNDDNHDQQHNHHQQQQNMQKNVGENLDLDALFGSPCVPEPIVNFNGDVEEETVQTCDNIQQQFHHSETNEEILQRDEVLHQHCQDEEILQRDEILHQICHGEEILQRDDKTMFYQHCQDEKDEEVLDDQNDEVIIEAPCFQNDQNDEFSCIEATTYFENEPSSLLLDQVEDQQQQLPLDETQQSLIRETLEELQRFSSFLLNYGQKLEQKKLSALDQVQEQEQSSLLLDQDQEQKQLSSLLLDQAQEEEQSSSLLLDQEQEEEQLSSLLLEQEQEQSSSLLLDQAQEEEQSSSLLFDPEQEEQLSSLLFDPEQEEGSLSSFMMALQQQSDCVHQLLHTDDIMANTSSIDDVDDPTLPIDPFHQKVKELEAREAKIKQAELQIEVERCKIDQEKIQIEIDKSKIHQEKIQIEHEKFKNKKDRNDIRTAIRRLRALVRHKVANHEAFWFMSAIHGANFLASMVLSDEDYYKMNYNHCFEYYRVNYNNYWGNNNLNSDNDVNFANFLTNSNIDFTNNPSNPLNIPDLLMHSSTMSGTNGLFDSYSNPLAESDSNTNLLASFTNVVEGKPDLLASFTDTVGGKPDLLASFTNVVENSLGLIDDTTNINNNNNNNNKGTSANGNGNNNSDDNNDAGNNKNDKNIKDTNDNNNNNTDITSYLQFNPAPLNSPMESLLQSSGGLNTPIPPLSARPVISPSAMPSYILPSTKPIQPMSPMSWMMLMAQPSTAQSSQSSTAQSSQPSTALPIPTTKPVPNKSLPNSNQPIPVIPRDNSINKSKNNFVQNNQNNQNNQKKLPNLKLFDNNYQNLTSICPSETCNTSNNSINLSRYPCPDDHYYTTEVDVNTGVPSYYVDHQNYRLGQFLPHCKLPFKSSKGQDIYTIIPDSQSEREDNCIFTTNGFQLKFFFNQEPNPEQVIVFYWKNTSESVPSNDTFDHETTIYIVSTGTFVANPDDVAYFKQENIKIREKIGLDKQPKAKKNDKEQDKRTAQELTPASTHKPGMQRINEEKQMHCTIPSSEDIKKNEEEKQRIEQEALGKKEKDKLKRKLAKEKKKLQLKEQEEQQRLQQEEQQRLLKQQQEEQQRLLKQQEEQQRLDAARERMLQHKQQKQEKLQQQKKPTQQQKIKPPDTTPQKTTPQKPTPQTTHTLICEKSRSPTSNSLNNNDDNNNNNNNHNNNNNSNNNRPTTPTDTTSSIPDAPMPTRVVPRIRRVDPQVVAMHRASQTRI